MRIRQTIAGLGLAALATTSLAACGSDNAADTAGTTASSSASASSPAGDASASAGGSTGTDSTDSADSADSTAPLDKDSLVDALAEGTTKYGSAHVTMKMTGAAAIDAEGDVSYAKGAPAMRMTMRSPQMGKGTMELRYVDTMMYITVPGTTPPGKFFRLDPSDKSNPMARSMGNLDEQMDPLSSVRAMKAGITKVRLVGKEQVQGEQMDHYKVTVDTKKMMAATGQQAAAASLPPRLTYDMWIDGKSLLRRMTFEVAGTRTVTEATDWGKKVVVQAPPAGKVISPPQG